MEAEAILSAAAMGAGAAGDFPLGPVCSLPIYQSGGSPRGSVRDEAAARMGDSSVPAHGSCGDLAGDGSTNSAPAESGESAVKPDPKGPGWINKISSD